MTQHQRFTFRFASAAEYRSEEVVLVSTHHDDARSGAWAILADRVHDRNARATWRITSLRQEPVGLYRIAQRLMASLALGLLLGASPAEATMPTYIEELTVGHFRSWQADVQSSYVLGVYSFATYSGLKCQTLLTVGEYQAAIVHNRVQLKDADMLPKAMLALFLRNGCEVK